MSRVAADDELSAAQTLLDELLTEVAQEEGTLAYGQKLGRGGEALTALRETEVTFGNPYDNLMRLTPDSFAAAGVTLNPIQLQQMENTFDFYYMTLNVSLHPKRGAQFQTVECRLEFGPDEMPIVQTIFPQPRWRTVLEWGGGLTLGLDGNLEWQAGLPGDAISELTGISGIPSAQLKTTNEMNSRIVVADYAFRTGRAEISATGEGNARATWRLQNPELHETQTIRFIVVFKVPKGTDQIELTGKVLAEPRMAWLVAQLSDVFGELSQRFKSLLGRDDNQRQGAERLPVGAHEKWVIELPQA